MFLFITLLKITQIKSIEFVNSKSCDCQSIFGCPKFAQLVKDRNFEELRQQEVCGFDGSQPKYCCVKEPRSKTTIKPQITTIPTLISTTVIDEDLAITENFFDGRISIENEEKYLVTAMKGCGISNGVRIFGGDEVSPHEYPWMAGLVYERLSSSGAEPKVLCGGVIIKPNVILTAAHCLGNGDFKLTKVKVGHSDLTSEDIIEINVEKIYSHPEFKRLRTNGLINDIALLKLSKKILFNSKIQPICLPSFDYPDEIFEEVHETEMIVAGWGALNRTLRRTNKLQKLELTFVQAEDCQNEYRAIVKSFKVLENRICASGRPGSDSCKGDSGGPLMWFDNNGSERYEVIGITSFGVPTCNSIKPGVYTRVSKHLDFIKKILKEIE